MRKDELVDRVAARANFYKVDVNTMLNACITEIHEAIQRGETVKIGGLFIMWPVYRKSRMTRNPKTNVWKLSEPSVKIKIKPSDTMVNMMNEYYRGNGRPEDDEEYGVQKKYL